MFESTKHKLRLKIIDLECDIKTLKRELKYAKECEERAANKLDNYLHEEARSASVELNWDSMDVISIERNVGGATIDDKFYPYKARTVVSVWIDDVKEGQVFKRVKDLYYHVDDEMHELIVEDYQRWKDGRDFGK